MFSKNWNALRYNFFFTVLWLRLKIPYSTPNKYIPLLRNKCKWLNKMFLKNH